MFPRVLVQKGLNEDIVNIKSPVYAAEALQKSAYFDDASIPSNQLNNCHPQDCCLGAIGIFFCFGEYILVLSNGVHLANAKKSEFCEVCHLRL